MDLKEPTTFEEQIHRLKKRRCVIDDEERCQEVLKCINYYRISAYFLPFKCNDDTYVSETTFEKIYRLYEFDRKLRQLLLGVLEEVEINLRTKLAYYHAHTYGASGYLNPSNFNMRHRHDKFIENFNREIESNKNSLIVRHHVSKYEGQFPIWVATEMFSFGMLSHFFSDMKGADRRFIANTYFNISDSQMQSWLRCLTDVRNICAHFGRLYYRKFAAVPARLTDCDFTPNRRLFDNIIVMKYLYPDKSGWNRSFLVQLEDLVTEYQDDIKLQHIGFPARWEKMLKK